MKKATQKLLSFFLVFCMFFSGILNTRITWAEETSAVRMSVNDESKTTEYASLMDAIHAIEALSNNNPDNTYTIYLDTTQYSIDKDYVMPKAKRISFVGTNTKSDGGGVYYISEIILQGNVKFQSDLEISDIGFVGSYNASLTANDVFASSDCRFGSYFNPITSVNINNFYGFSYNAYEKLNSKNYANADELANDLDLNKLGIYKLEFYCALNAATVTSATNAVYFYGLNTTSHIDNYIYLSNVDNSWQGKGILFSTFPGSGSNDYIAVDVSNVLFKYVNTSNLYWYMSTMKQEKSRISIGNISVDNDTSTAPNIQLTLHMGGYSDGNTSQPDCNFDINGQVSGIENITCSYDLDGFDSNKGLDWRTLMKSKWGNDSFKALTVSQPQNNDVEFDCTLNFVNGNMGGYNFKLTKNNNEYRIDFSQPLYELVKLDNYIEKDGIYYSTDNTYAIPTYYTGDSDTLTIPASITVDDVEYNVLAYYYSTVPISLKTNVKTIVLPEDTEHVQQLGVPNGAYYNIVNTMLEGGNDNSALERFEIAGDNISYSTDEEGNLYNANKSILYCCPPAKKNYTFPDSVTKIGDNAFLGTHIENLTIPEQIEIVGQNAFTSMKQLTTVKFEGTNVIDFRENSFNNVDSENVTIYSDNNEIVKNEALLYGLKYVNSLETPEEPAITDAPEEPAITDAPEEPAITKAPDITLKGDLNNDNTVDLQDVQLALKGSLNIISLTEQQTLAGDINGNGSVDLTDTQLVLKYALLIIPSLDNDNSSDNNKDNNNNDNNNNGDNNDNNNSGDNDNDNNNNGDNNDDGTYNCEKSGHTYNIIKDATFEESGIKQCTHCNKEITIEPKNKKYQLIFVRTPATENGYGYQIIIDEDTGKYREETIEPLGDNNASE